MLKLHVLAALICPIYPVSNVYVNIYIIIYNYMYISFKFSVNQMNGLAKFSVDQMNGLAKVKTSMQEYYIFAPRPK